MSKALEDQQCDGKERRAGEPEPTALGTLQSIFVRFDDDPIEPTEKPDVF